MCYSQSSDNLEALEPQHSLLGPVTLTLRGPLTGLIEWILRNLLKIKTEDGKHENVSLVSSLSHNIIPGGEEENKKIVGVAIENNVRYLHSHLTLSTFTLF